MNPTIKLMGDMKQNIHQLVLSLNCICGAKSQLLQILHIYADKISKLRNQRNQLQSRCSSLQNKIQRISSSHTIEPAFQLFKPEQNIFQMLCTQEIKNKPVVDVMERKLVSEETLLLSEENEENMEVRKAKQVVKRKKCGIEFSEYLQKRMKEKLTKQRINQDMETLNCHRRPFRDRSNVRN